MASEAFEVRWINEDRKYGLFATKDIPAGESIYNEWATIVDARQFIETIDLWKKSSGQDLSLSEDQKLAPRSQADQIFHGMQRTRDSVKKHSKYDSVMEIHEARIGKDDTTTLLSVDLYNIIMNESSTTTSDGELKVHIINAFLTGMRQVFPPRHYFWGPFTSLINHGCKPRAALVALGSLDSAVTRTMHTGTVGLRSLVDIKKDQEITVEYRPALGTYEQRRENLRGINISKCNCDDCDDEEELFNQHPKDQDLPENLRTLKDRGEYLHYFYTKLYQYMHNSPPARFFQTLSNIITNLQKDRYFGVIRFMVYDRAITYSQVHNDNIRVYWFSSVMLRRSVDAYGEDNLVTNTARTRFESSIAGKVWNEEKHRDLFTIAENFNLSWEHVSLIFMLDADPNDTTYHLVAIDGDKIVPVSKEENQRIVASTLANRERAAADAGSETETEIAPEDLAAAEEAADRAAAELIAAEEKEAAKKTRAQEKKKRKAQRKKDKKQAKRDEEEQKLAARVAAVLAADTVPALPLPRPARRQSPAPAPAPVQSLEPSRAPTPAPAPTPPRAPTPPSSPVAPPSCALALSSTDVPQPPVAQAQPEPQPEPLRRLVRSSSAPEPALVARFHANTPLRPTPSAEDCISDDGREIRFGVSLQRPGNELDIDEIIGTQDLAVRMEALFLRGAWM